MTKRKVEILEIGGSGNTSTEPRKKKQIAQSKRWCFTYNNYPVEILGQIVATFEKMNVLYIIGKEVGEQGTPHLQGYIESPKRCRPSAFSLPTKIHWEKCKGDRAENIKYCSKDGDYVHSTQFRPRKALKLIDPTYWWEQEILQIIRDEPDDRTIFWYWSEGGKVGKTQFCKYLTAKHGAVPIGGKGADVRNAVVEYLLAMGETPDFCVFPIPKSYNTEYLSYEGLENVKDMYFYSGKFHGAAICGPCPHLFVFSNEPPKLYKCSEDRWVVVQIDKAECEERRAMEAEDRRCPSVS